VKVRVYVKDDEIIVSAVDENMKPIDADGTLFGPKSGRYIEDYDGYDADLTREVIIIRPSFNVRLK
jgi:hypothetical protein